VPTVEEIQRRLRDDGTYYGEHCLKLVDLYGELVPLIDRKGQLKIEAAIQKQEAAGEPVRIIIDKTRRCGASTKGVSTLIRKATQNKNSQAQIVAQNRGTAAELFDIARRMWSNLPNEEWIKPPLYQDRDSKDTKFLWWGNPDKYSRNLGDLGLNSQLTVDTAQEVSGGRGLTIRYLLATEVAHWPDPNKALGLLNAVSDVPGTVIIIESTPKGFDDFFKPTWDRAEAGESGYIPVFIGWQDVEHFTLAFPGQPGSAQYQEERERFIAGIGTGPWGEDEPDLIERHGVTPEQLNWRRRTIADKTQGKLELFRQEYPSNAAESFIGSGRHVFSVVFSARAIARTEEVMQLPIEEGGPQVGIFQASDFKTRRTHDGTVEVPTAAIWIPSEDAGLPISHDYWTRWELPKEEGDTSRGQHIIAVDPTSGEGNTSGSGDDWSAIQVIDHRTREQAARLRTKALDPDEVAFQALLAALYFNDALITVETTGGYGVPITRKLWDAFGYRRLYKRKAVEQSSAKASDRLGWDTNRRTKPLMIEGLREMLREGTHGMRDLQTALELNTYVVDDKGRQGADKSAHDDLLSAYMQGQEVARETRLRPDGPSGITHTWTTDRRRF
jgi:hypothetical protein